MKLVDLQEARYAAKGFTLDDFERGDRILLIQKSLREVEIRAAVIKVVDLDNNGLVTFGDDYKNKEYLGSGQGAFFPEEIGKKRYGLIDVRFVERERERKERIRKS